MSNSDLSKKKLESLSNDFGRFENRYIIKGRLELLSAAHVGSGRGNSKTDAEVMKDEKELPYIPGSSLKGIIRSNAERYIAALETSEIYTCLLDEELMSKVYGERKKCRTVIRKVKDDEKVNFDLNEDICHVCRIFGSTEMASKIKISDAFLIESTGMQLEQIFEIRDGVKIDRDTGSVESAHKFDFEVVNRGASFHFEMILENVDYWEIGVVLLGMQDFLTGEQNVGGRTSKGLGRCILHLEKCFYSDKTSLKNFITRGSDDIFEMISFNDINDSAMKDLAKIVAMGEKE